MRAAEQEGDQVVAPQVADVVDLGDHLAVAPDAVGADVGADVDVAAEARQGRVAGFGAGDQRARLRVEGAEALEIGGQVARQDGEIRLHIAGCEALGRARELAAPDALAQLRQLVNDLPGQIFAILAAAVNTENVNATGNVTAAGTGRFDAGVTSVGVYGNLVSAGSYRAQYINASGSMGYVPSSRQFKTDIQTAPSVAEAILAMRVVTFRYLNAVEELGNEATVEWGVIAEEIHDLGLAWLVDYDGSGKPFGIKYERLVLATIPHLQEHETRLQAIEQTLEALRDEINTTQ